MPVSGSTAAPPQLAPPTDPGRVDRALQRRRREERSEPEALMAFTACARISGVKSARSSIVTPWYSNGAGLVGKGCVGDARSPGTSDGGTGRSSIGQIGSPVTRSNV